MPRAAKVCRPMAGAKRFSNAEDAAMRQRRRKHATYSRPWRQIRAAKLAANPWCEDCLVEGFKVSANQVDHVNGDDADNRWCNLRSLCTSHHSSKTVKHDGGFGRPINRKKR